MSNYYKSKCCKAPANIVAMLGKAGAFQCTKCFKECQVIAMLDTPGGVPKEDTLISKQAVLDLITKEIAIAHTKDDGGKTSRLTSLYMAITKL